MTKSECIRRYNYYLSESTNRLVARYNRYYSMGGGYYNESYDTLNEDIEILSEAIQFKFWVKFKDLCQENPELRKYNSTIKEACDIVAKYGGDTNRDGVNKCFKCIMRVIHILNDINYGIFKVFCWLVIPLLYMLIDRLWAWAYDNIEYSLDKDYGQKIRTELVRLLGKKDLDKKAKDEIQKMIDKIDSEQKKIDNESYGFLF
jgi:hypothetical protein